MNFGEKLKDLRETNDLTQEQLAKMSGISSRMIQRYEYGTSCPRFVVVEKIAKALGVSTDELLGNDEVLVAEANEKYGAKGARQAKKLTKEVTGLFTGGDMAEEDMDIMMKAIQDAYWIAKEKNRKYKPKKFNSDN